MRLRKNAGLFHWISLFFVSDFLRSGSTYAKVGHNGGVNADRSGC
jgi:hypothetical protein